MTRLLLAWLLCAVAFVAYLRAQPARDIVFVTKKGCAERIVDCATEVHFNGEWYGTKLCHAKRCVRYEEVFDDPR